MSTLDLTDLMAEAADMSALFGALSAADWQTETQFKAWTIFDVLAHLYHSDQMALAATGGEAAFADIRAEMLTQMQSGRSLMDAARAETAGMDGPALFTAWQETFDALCTALTAVPEGQKLPWFGPPMGARMMATARQMEMWAHTQAVYDVLGCTRVDTDRLKNIAVIGVKTFGFCFQVNGKPVPEVVPRVVLDAPSGDVWSFGDATSDNHIKGPATAFCQVVTQTRNIADTSLAVSGATAAEWMAIAQCFAGPPHPPPAPGTRFKQKDRG